LKNKPGTSAGGSGGGTPGSKGQKSGGSNNNAVVIPSLPLWGSDVMIRRTISTNTASSLPYLSVKKEPTAVMKRVKDLPVEEIVWKN
jgi:hypothetical protein